MNTLKVNPDLRVVWNKGRSLLSVPGQPLKELHGKGGLSLLSEFAVPRAVREVIQEYEDPMLAEDAISTLFQNGALIFDSASAALPPDLRYAEALFHDIQAAVESVTMGTPAINYALFKATEYICRSGIKGAVVESGVWKGGSAMICAMTLAALGDTEREIRLYDTFDGSWPAPGPEDGTIYGRSYEDTLSMHATAQKSAPAPEDLRRQGLDLDSVRARLASTGYPMDRIRVVTGRVQDTIPDNAPEQIALLRLDTDFFDSTYHELQHLYPRLAQGGVLLVDDYPTETGATRAVDRYFAERAETIFLTRIDIQGRIGVKLGC